mmetsp:Transcript_6111/g.16653  ORF Transcript_6111/g.16653 Transcript_6111/m.16653 type:complete len:316 (-) Transcript_6111:103-1050(-)
MATSFLRISGLMLVFGVFLPSLPHHLQAWHSVLVFHMLIQSRLSFQKRRSEPRMVQRPLPITTAMVVHASGMRRRCASSPAHDGLCRSGRLCPLVRFHDAGGRLRDLTCLSLLQIRIGDRGGPSIGLALAALLLSGVLIRKMLRLDGRERDGVYDVLDTSSTAEIVDGTLEALQHGTDGHHVGSTLDGLVGRVAGVEIWEDQHGGLACYLRIWSLALRHIHRTGGIVLQGAVHQQVGTAGLGERGGLAHLVDIVAASAGSGAVGDQGNARIDAKGLGRFRALEGDIGKLLGRRIRVDRAIAVNQDLIGQAHEEDG